LEKNEITFAVVVKVVSTPSLEMGISLTGGITGRRRRGLATGDTFPDARRLASAAGTAVVACSATHPASARSFTITLILDGENDLSVACCCPIGTHN
jgi:hypothetical protein